MLSHQPRLDCSTVLLFFLLYSFRDGFSLPLLIIHDMQKKKAANKLKFFLLWKSFIQVLRAEGSEIEKKGRNDGNLLSLNAPLQTGVQ